MRERDRNIIEIRSPNLQTPESEAVSSNISNAEVLLKFSRKGGFHHLRFWAFVIVSVHSNCPIAYNVTTAQVQSLLRYGQEMQNQELREEENIFMVLGKEKYYTCYAKRAINWALQRHFIHCQGIRNTKNWCIRNGKYYVGRGLISISFKLGYHLSLKFLSSGLMNRGHQRASS